MIDERLSSENDEEIDSQILRLSDDSIEHFRFHIAVAVIARRIASRASIVAPHGGGNEHHVRRCDPELLKAVFANLGVPEEHADDHSGDISFPNPGVCIAQDPPQEITPWRSFLEPPVHPLADPPLLLQNGESMRQHPLCDRPLGIVDHPMLDATERHTLPPYVRMLHSGQPPSHGICPRSTPFGAYPFSATFASMYLINPPIFVTFLISSSSISIS